MQVSKWGNSLAIRLPSAVVEALDLKEGDQIDIQVAGTRQLDIDRNNDREEAIKRLRARRIPLPPGWKFDREEANAR
jgi:antitoxin MazE